MTAKSFTVNKNIAKARLNSQCDRKNSKVREYDWMDYRISE